MEKIVSKKIFQTKIKPQIREENKKIALCHGVFDLVHAAGKRDGRYSCCVGYSFEICA